MNNDFVRRIMEAIAALPEEERVEAIQALLSDMMYHMPRKAIIEMRLEIVAEFEPDIPIIESTLNQIDGHLTMRDMGMIAEIRGGIDDIGSKYGV